MRSFPFLLCIILAFAAEQNPKVIIVGSGPAGIAAASKLLQNGITDVTILEAENRIGGRVYSRKFEGYWIDLGGQWVAGDKNNAAYDFAMPLGLLSQSMGPGLPDRPPLDNQFRGSSGAPLSVDASKHLINYVNEVIESGDLKGLSTGSMGEYMTKMLNAYYDKHPEISADLREPLTQSVHLAQATSIGAVDWNDISINGTMSYRGDEGYPANNWKERSYGTILDILMKKYPDPAEELPVVSKTLLNKKVAKIKCEGGLVRVTTLNGDEYTADHVIFTPSLGVLKADYEKLFDPPLPEKTVNSIKHLGFGHNTKILLYYDEPWWTADNLTMWNFFWTAEDQKEIENNPERRWMLGITYALIVEWKPKLLLLWLSGPHCAEMENTPDELFKNQMEEFIQRFYGNTYNVTRPKNIIRSSWNTNENFRGTYSYRSLDSVNHNATARDLGEPVKQNDKPVILFAGEATEPVSYGTVHGAIASGWREADRLVDLYRKKN